MISLSTHFFLEQLCFSAEVERYNEQHPNNVIYNHPNEQTIVHLVHLCIYILEPIRDFLKHDFDVISGYRSMAVNNLMGVSMQNRHFQGDATEIQLAREEDYPKVIKYIQSKLEFDVMRLGVTRNGDLILYISYDFNGFNRRIFRNETNISLI